MKKCLFLLISTFLCIGLFAEKYDFEEVILVGVENPICLAISSDGLRMVVVDQPKKGFPVMKQCYRPYLESKWGAAIPIDPINQRMDKNTRIDGPCFSFDNRYLFFSANFKEGLGGMDIYYCEVEDDTWSAPINLGAPINSVEDENFPSLSGNNRTFFFTREKKMKKLESYRTGELFKSEIITGTKEWSVPEKLNTQINKGGIAYPKIYDDNKTIHYAMVNDDKENWKIHWTKRLNDLHWYLPQKMDTLASKTSEISPFYCKQDEYLYFVKYDQGGFSPKGEIFRYKLDKYYQSDQTIHVKGKVLNPINAMPVNATVLVSDPLTGRINYLTQSDGAEGEWDVLLNANKSYMFHVSAPGYSHVYRLFEENMTLADVEYNIDLFPLVNVSLNVYDKEELWPLNATIEVTDQSGNIMDAPEEHIYIGQKKLQLPIGTDFTISAAMKDYEKNNLELALSNIILFDEFIRDIELVPLKRTIEIYVTDIKTNTPLFASVELIDKRGRKLIPETVKGVIGLYQIDLREGESFDVEVKGPRGFAFQHVAFDLDRQRDLSRLLVELQPLVRKVPILLNNINFESNSADLMETSYVELDRVVTLLNENPEIYVEIMAHTDDVGSEKYNTILADKRAKSVVEYLIVNRIDSDRLVARGYGEAVPVVPNDSDKNRALNRRVEMKILDENNAGFYIEERIFPQQ